MVISHTGYCTFGEDMQRTLILVMKKMVKKYVKIYLLGIVIGKIRHNQRQMKKQKMLGYIRWRPQLYIHQYLQYTIIRVSFLHSHIIPVYSYHDLRHRYTLFFKLGFIFNVLRPMMTDDIYIISANINTKCIGFTLQCLAIRIFKTFEMSA